LGTEFIGYNSEEELPQIITGLINDEEMMKRISANAREKIKSQHTMELRIMQVLDSLDQTDRKRGIE